MKNPAGKTRKFGEVPYAWWISPSTGWKYVLLKSYQADNSKEYARWFMWVEGSFKEYGDTYCAEARPALRDAMAAGGQWEYDKTVWSTPGEFVAWVLGMG